MYSRKFHQSLLQSRPNLRNVILEANISSKTFNQYSFYIQKFTSADAYKTLQSFQSKIHTIVKNDKALRIIRNNLIAIPRSLKDQSSKILRIWAHQCECVVAQRLRRSQQMFCLYSKLWEENALKEFLNKMRQEVTRRGKKFIVGAVGISSAYWDSIRISDDEMLQYVNELDYIYKLRANTITCPDCEHKNLDMCTCESTKGITLHYENWTLMVQKDDLLVWRRPHPDGNFEYKVYGAYNDVSAEDFMNVQVDIFYRKHWDKTAVELEIVDTDPQESKHGDLIYWELLWPRLFTNRDYVFKRRYMVDYTSKTALIVNRSTQHPSYPSKSDKYRIKDYWSYMVIKPNTSDFKQPGLQFGLTYYDNPGVNIPSAITTWVAMRAMPDFLNNLRMATTKYKQFCSAENHPCVCNVFSEEECKKQESEMAKEKCQRDDSQCIYPRIGCAPGSDIMTSPSPMMQHDNSKSSYWKYLQSSFYIS